MIRGHGRTKGGSQRRSHLGLTMHCNNTESLQPVMWDCLSEMRCSAVSVTGSPGLTAAHMAREMFCRACCQSLQTPAAFCVTHPFTNCSLWHCAAVFELLCAPLRVHSPHCSSPAQDPHFVHGRQDSRLFDSDVFDEDTGCSSPAPRLAKTWNER